MTTIFGEIGREILGTYRELVAFLPPGIQSFINLFLISLVIVVYSILIWKFYRFIAKRNLIDLNLRQYNLVNNKLMSRTFAIILYTVEYLIVLPFIVFLWFAVFTIFLIILTSTIDLTTILIISATVIVAIRMTAYFSEDLSKDVAKLLPFTLLGVSITGGGAFSFDKILSQIVAIPSFISEIFSYLIFIFVIEFLLRTVENLFVVSGVNQSERVQEVPEIKEDIK